jgi:hypothetical protein
MLAHNDRKRQGKKRKQFFFEKKNQKTFVYWSLTAAAHQNPYPKHKISSPALAGEEGARRAAVGR